MCVCTLRTKREACGALTSILLPCEEKAARAHMRTIRKKGGRDGWMVSHKLQVGSCLCGWRGGLAICVCGPDSLVKENPKKARLQLH